MKKRIILIAGIAAILFTSCGGLADELLKEEEQEVKEVSKPTNLQEPDFMTLPYTTGSFVLPEEYNGKDCFLIYSNLTNNNLYNTNEKIENFSQQNNASRSAVSEEVKKVIYQNAVYMGDGVYRDEVHYELPEELKKIKKIRQDNYNPRTAYYNSSSNGSYYNPKLTDSLTEGAKVNFWYNSSEGSDFTEGEFTLKKVGEKCRIWVLNNNPDVINTNTFTTKDYKRIAGVIDSCYSKMTAIFGSNYCNFGEEFIYADDDTKLEVLVYDLLGDATINQNGGTFGFFYNRDFYMNHSKSNKCQLINIDSYFLKKYEDKTLLTLIHEFQHLLNYCNKNTYESWFTEMLSMCAEDIFLTQLGLEDGAGPMSRFANGWFGKPYQGFGNWYDSDIEDDDENPKVYYSYANAYAFGAFLMRNFGGVKLINDIATNDFDSADDIAITIALFNLGYNIYFDEVFQKFGMTYIFPEEDQNYSLNWKITQKFNKKMYTLNAIDLDSDWFNCASYSSDTAFKNWANQNLYIKTDTLKYAKDKYSNFYVVKGPKIFAQNYVLTDPIEKYGFAVYYLGKGIGGKTYNITRAPAASSTEQLTMTLVAK